MGCALYTGLHVLFCHFIIMLHSLHYTTYVTALHYYSNARESVVLQSQQPHRHITIHQVKYKRVGWSWVDANLKEKQIVQRMNPTLSLSSDSVRFLIRLYSCLYVNEPAFLLVGYNNVHSNRLRSSDWQMCHSQLCWIRPVVMRTEGTTH